MFLLKWLVKILEIILVSTIVYINQDFLQTIFILRILVHVLYRFFNDEYSTSGASSGIGAATALEFAKNGAKLVLAARNVERLNEVANQCSSKGLQQENVRNKYQNITKMNFITDKFSLRCPFLERYSCLMKRARKIIFDTH